MQIKIVNSEKEPLFLDDVKKAIAALPEKGGVWDVENPQNVVVALENICAKLNDTLELQMAHDKESICNVGVEYDAVRTRTLDVYVEDASTDTASEEHLLCNDPSDAVFNLVSHADVQLFQGISSRFGRGERKARRGHSFADPSVYRDPGLQTCHHDGCDLSGVWILEQLVSFASVY